MSNTQPLVSVCIPSYNHGDYVREAIESVLAQTYPNWELIVIDDASPDNSQEILKEFQNRYPDRMRLVIHDENQGISATVNEYASMANGEYIALMCSDDMMHPERLARQVEHLEARESVAAVCSRVQYIDKKGQPAELNTDVFARPIENIRLQMLEGNFLNGPSMLVRTEVFRATGGHNQALDYVHDYDFWLRVLDDHDIERLEECLTLYRIHDTNTSMHMPEETPIATVYETVAVAIAAMNRWPTEKLFGITVEPGSDLWKTSMAQAKVELARICVANDQRFFGRVFLGLTPAYTLLLEANELDPNNAEVRKSLNDVYALLGDELRAKGKGVVRRVDWEDNYATSSIFALRDQREDKNYIQWVEAHKLSEGDAQILAERMMTQWKQQPTLHLITYFDAGQENALADTVDSLQSQLYKQWGLTVISAHACPDPIFEEAGALEWIQYDGAAADAVNEVVRQSQADWIGWLGVGDEFVPTALFEYADYINIKASWNLIYPDDDHYGNEGQRIEPRFKPDINLDLLRSTNYIGSFCLVRRSTLNEIGGYTSAPSVATYDCVLKVLDHSGEDSIGHIANVLLHRSEENIMREQDDDYEVNAKVIVVDHLARCKVDGTVVEGLLPGTWRVKYQHADTPKVSIIIPTKDQIEYFSACIESVLSKTSYSNYEIIVVDNGSVGEDTEEYYEALIENHDDKVTLIKVPGEFNFSRMNNEAARYASGEYLIMLNNDTVVIQDYWIERMLNHAMRGEVGIVGSRLVFVDKKLQHAGVVLGMQGAAGHPNIGTPMLEAGVLNRNQCDQNYSAVTAACLMIRKSVFDEINGLDEERFAVSYNDVDLCMKATQAGYKIVWTPFATLIHHGSVSQMSEFDGGPKLQRMKRERNAMLANWLPQLKSDPAWNRNLSLRYTSTVVENNFDVHWDTNFDSRPRILGFPMNRAGCGQYRVFGPLAALEDKALAQVGYVQPFDMLKHPVVPTVLELERMAPDTLLLQSVVNDAHIDALEMYKQFSTAFRVYDLEDLKTIIPDKNCRKGILFPDMEDRLDRTISQCDRLTVTTEPLIEAHQHLIDDIRVVPNYLTRSYWGGLVSKRGVSAKPRVGWVGAQQHHGDLEILIDVVKQTAAEVDWVFFGMCLDEIKPYVAEIHDYVAYENYPQKMASLNLDLAVAPLEIHPFNVAKSNLRLLEYGAMGWPVVCTDIFPYQNAPVKRVENTTSAWVDAIRERVNDLDANYRDGNVLKAWVNKNWFLEDHVHVWMNALTPGKAQVNSIVVNS